MKKLEVHTRSYQKLVQDFSQWLAALGYSESSQTVLPQHVREFLHWLEGEAITEMKLISSHHVKGFMAYLNERGNERKQGQPLSEAHLAKFLQGIKLLAKYGKQTGKSVFSVAQGVIQPRKSAGHYLSKTEVQSLYEATSHNAYGLRDRAMLSVFYGCGLRKNEGLHLDVSDVLFKQGLLYVRKGKNRKERYVPMGAKVQADLISYLEKARPLFMPELTEMGLFLNYTGHRLSGVSHAARLHKLVVKAEIEVKCSLHTLRHSIATHLLRNGMPLRQVSEFLGHASLESTQIYTHIEK